MSGRRRLSLAVLVLDFALASAYNARQGDIMAKKIVSPNRTIALSVRLTADDQARLDRIVKALSEYVPVGKGKAISAALKIADEKLSKRGGS